MTALPYPDTSFLVSLYGDDRFSAEARAAVTTLDCPLLVTDLIRLEFENATRLLRFRRLLTPRQAARVASAFSHDEKQGLLKPLACDWRAAFARARILSESHTAQRGHRAMDVLHVATALSVQAKMFFSFDEWQRSLAKNEGLTLNPLSAS